MIVPIFIDVLSMLKPREAIILKKTLQTFDPEKSRPDWEWFSIIKPSRTFILDETPHACHPLVQVVDNLERTHKLGLIFEWKVGEGKLLVCTSPLNSWLTYSSCNRKGEAGSPSLLYRLAKAGLSAHPYRTYFGSGIRSFHSTTLLFSILAVAHLNFLSWPAMAKWPGSSPFPDTSPPPT
jgi:hypothetical protein